MTKNVPVEKLTRLKRNYSDILAFNKVQKETCKRLSARDYPRWSLERAKSIVASKSREQLLRNKKPNQGTIINLLLWYLLQYNNIKGIINKYLPILSRDEKLKKIFTKPIPFSVLRLLEIWCPLVCFQRCNTRNTLGWISAVFTNADTPYVKHVALLTRVTPLGTYINCNTKNVIYMIVCQECQLKYSGHTTNALKVRIRRHLCDATSPIAVNMSAASRHFATAHCGKTSGFTFLGLEKVFCPKRGEDIKRKLLAREAFWIITLGTRCPS